MKTLKNDERTNAMRLLSAAGVAFRTAEELAGLAWLVDKGGYSFEGVTVCLGNDISLENTDGTVGARLWTPIGANLNKAFHGTFDGQGFAVYDMTVSSTGSYGALFGCCVGATIQNLSVYGSVTGTAAASYAAGVVAYLSGGALENCANYAAVTASGTHAGGLAAMVRDGARIEGCFNYGPVSGSSGVGGLAGVSDSGEDRLLASWWGGSWARRRAAPTTATWAARTATSAAWWATPTRKTLPP